VENSNKVDGHIGLLDRTEKLLSKSQGPSSKKTSAKAYVENYLNALNNINNLGTSEEKSIKEVLELISTLDAGDIDGELY